MNQSSDTTAGTSEPPTREMMDAPALSTVAEHGIPSLEKAYDKLPKESIIVQRPGREPGSWERWLFTPGAEAHLLPQEATLPKHCEILLTLPSSALFSWPLWVANEGDNLDLVRLELSGRHLLKRGMEDSLGILPILDKGERHLLLAAAPEEPFPSDLMPPHWQRATRFELPARLHAGSSDHDLILWEEWGAVQMAFYRNQQPVWFCGVRSQGLAALLHRIALRLLSEGVLEQLPTHILLDALPSEVAAACQTSLAALFPGAVITCAEHGKAALPAILPKAPFDLPPTEAREERYRLQQRQKLFSFAIAGAILYLLLLLWGAGDLFIRQNALQNLRREIAKIEQPSQEAQQQSGRWKALRPLIDPTTYALDLLSAAAAPTTGGKVRLTLFALEQGHLHIAGEAGDLTQANSTIDQLKKSPLLQQFDWNNTQPQLAGKNSVKFDIEGAHPDATPQSSEEPQPTP
jgi:hypothetical protein